MFSTQPVHLSSFQNWGEGTVDLSVSNNIAILSLNNSAKKNALSPRMMTQFSQHLTQIEAWTREPENPLFGLILTGQNQTFCSGFGK